MFGGGAQSPPNPSRAAATALFLQVVRKITIVLPAGGHPNKNE